jgi:hypothetical protein
VSRAACTRCGKLPVLRSQNGFSDTSLSANASGQLNT